MCETQTYLSDNIFIRFGTKSYRQIIDIPMGTDCANLIADLFLLCYERNFMASLSYNKEAEIIHLGTYPGKNQVGCMERVVHHSHENKKKTYMFKIAINENAKSRS